ncbi:MAG: toprim domain-containing protein [Synergistaceae bacterium]
MSDLLQFVQDCHSELINGTDQEIEEARQYLKNDRKILEESLKCHTIGYCKKDFDIPDLIRFYGTANKPKEEKWDISRRIKGRIIVPIFSEFGKVVAFATRVPTTEPGNPWWNLPSPFQKGNYLFLMDKARKHIYEKNKVYIVEGYIDAITLFQSGLKNVVAVMGTAYTLRKVGMTARYCNNVCLCFDTDPNGSGQKAKFMATAILNKYAFCESISTIDALPMKEDPASFVSINGLSEFLKMERVMDENEIIKIYSEVSKGRGGKLIDAK